MPLPSRVVVAGGTGLLGRALADHLAATGHDVIVLTRQRSSATVDPGHPQAVESRHAGVRLAHWTPDGTPGPWTPFLDGACAVVNLAGESIGGGRWTAARKQRLRASRLDATRSLVAALAACGSPPGVFVSASAVGYYGLRGDRPLTEEDPAGEDFLARLCADWEDAARNARRGGRLAIVRSGVVLDRNGGALPRMVAPFRLFAGGPLGSGSQYISWIHLEDWVEMVGWILADARVGGPINATSPGPVTNRDFARAVGKILRRPAWIPAPGFALRALLGEMAGALLLGGQRVVPAKATSLGYRFRFADIDAALASVLGPRP